MDQKTAAAFATLSERIGRLEQSTSAEVLVAVAPQSGSYRDVHYLVGVSVAFAGLAFVLCNPWTEHHPLAVPLDVALLFVAGHYIASVVPGVRRCLTSGRRRARQVADAADLAFLREVANQTRHATGLLLYLSLFERQFEIRADRGIERALEPGAWNAFLFEARAIGTAPDPLQALAAAIDRLGELLCAALPAGASNPNELPDRPRHSAHVE